MHKALSPEPKSMQYIERLQFNTVKTIHRNYSSYQSHATFRVESLDGKLSFGRCKSSMPPVLCCIKSQECLNPVFKACGLDNKL